MHDLYRTARGARRRRRAPRPRGAGRRRRGRPRRAWRARVFGDAELIALAGGAAAPAGGRGGRALARPRRGGRSAAAAAGARGAAAVRGRPGGRYDRTLVVTAPDAIRRGRLAARGGLDAARRARGAAAPEAEKRRRADDVLVNDGDLAALDRAVRAYVDRSRRRRRRVPRGARRRWWCVVAAVGRLRAARGARLVRPAALPAAPTSTIVRGHADELRPRPGPARGGHLRGVEVRPATSSRRPAPSGSCSCCRRPRRASPTARAAAPTARRTCADPEINVRYGAWYLRHLRDKYARPPATPPSWRWRPTTPGRAKVDEWVAADAAGRSRSRSRSRRRAPTSTACCSLAELYRRGYDL